MSREKQRQQKRLLALADYIEKNPNLYDQTSITTCVVALGNRFYRGKLGNHPWLNSTPRNERFASRYGVTAEQAEQIYTNQFGNVLEGHKNRGKYARRPVKEAIAFIRALAG